jgi:hypothetical protein
VGDLARGNIVRRPGRGAAAPDDGASPDLVLQTFTAVFCAGVLLHEIQWGATPWGPHVLVLLAAVLGLTRPGIRTLVGVLAALCIELLVDLPVVFNHTFVLGVLGGGLALWWLATPSAPWRSDAAAFLARVGPVIRTTVLLMWGFAFLAKLNHGFLDAANSCAVWIVDNVPLVTVPEPAFGAVVASTLLVEGLVPLLLVVRRTRLLGVAVAWVFHLVAAFGGHTAFSAVALALYLLFLPPGLVTAAARWAVDRVPRRSALAAQWRRPWVPVVLLLVVMAGMAVIQLAPAPWDGRGRRFVPTLLYLPFATAYAVALLAAVRRHHRAGLPVAGAGSLRLHGVVPLLIVAVLTLNAASPYLGLKTMWSLTMYSNLRTEPGEWNHLIVPEQTRVFTWQDDLVTIYDAHPDVARSLGLGTDPTPHRVPRLRILRVAAEAPDAPVRLDPAADEWRSLGELAEGDFTVVHDRLAHLRSVPLEPRCQL